ncbi:MAG: cellulose biosynthesis cyclic di-GMP-binding regulatory protein BcsB [Pusillimonas sp.]
MIRTGRFWEIARTCIFGLLVSATSAAWAQPTAADRVGDALHSSYAVSLEQYNRYVQWRLHGVNGRRGVVFGLRADEQVKGLQLDLAYRYSPALLEDLSHLNVILNGAVVASLPLPQQQADHAGKTMVDLPLAHLQPYNYLELQLIGHYTMGCEDPLHADLWANIDESSRLVFDVAHSKLPDELSLLPTPFFDPRDVRGLDLAFVLGEPTDKRLEAAGIVASWLGALAGYREARFEVSAHDIPERGHAIVVLGPNESLEGVTLPTVQGPTVAMRANPHDPAGKLLVIAGRDDNEIRSAAVSLVLGAQALSGPTATVAAIQEQVREPYDAPNWLPTNRPVALGELLPLRDFTVLGFDPPPVDISLRLPPDLSDWRTKTVPLELLYRHSAVDERGGATLDVSVNQQPVESIPLASNKEAAHRLVSRDDSVLSETVLLPMSMLESLAGLQFQFRYPVPNQRECRGSLVDVWRSAIDPRSTLDLSGLPKHKAMPDLAAFSTSGFPFTRMADLSETTVVLPAKAGENEFSAFLSLLGKMGQVTGYPATGVSLTRDGTGLMDKDLLVLDAGSSSEVLSQWSRYLPAARRTDSSSTTGGGIGGWIGGWIAALSDLLVQSPLRLSAAGPVSASTGGAYAAGFESPVSHGRSVVVVAGADGPSLRAAVELMLTDETQSRRLQGSLALLRDGRIESLSDSKTYYVGSLGPYQTMAWFLSTQPILLFLLYLAAAVLIAIVLYLSLRARAHRRLGAGRSGTQ